MIYIFQCHRCFIVSGKMSTDPKDAPPCCGGEQMSAVPMGESESDTPRDTLDDMVQKMIVEDIWKNELQ